MKKRCDAQMYSSLAWATVLVLSSSYDAIARGGFGGGGGGRSFGGGDFGRGGSGDRGGFGDRGDFDRMFDDQGAGRNAFRATARPADASGRVMDSGIRNYGTGLASDGAFGRIAGTATAAGRLNNTYRWTPADLSERAGYLNSHFDHWNWFNRNWWADHRWAWYDRYWPDYWCWGGVGWVDLAGYWGVDDDDSPAYYDYGNNITYQDDNVYYGSQPLEPASTYYQQAQSLAVSAPPAPPPAKAQTEKTQGQASTSQWRPFGVFALTTGDQGEGSQLFQLAVDKKGTIRGNYYNALTDETKQVSGAVDKKNMRACWTITGNKNIVYDTGVGNLLKGASPILVHYSKSNTRQCMLIRLKNPNTTTATTQSHS